MRYCGSEVSRHTRHAPKSDLNLFVRSTIMGHSTVAVNEAPSGFMGPVAGLWRIYILLVFSSSINAHLHVYFFIFFTPPSLLKASFSIIASSRNI